ncbi:hypothetical protein J437_LFUL001611 [Ladona fulva]|uniref:Mitochondrial import inner membrane translocase subunit Tim29 n=1 Tax=Ladona fulva TaxID=123851 RepID=A0A8K0KM31_LADFU|nr:hypothetical protein J437_LFUL001611 [Ladona fulva]
MFQNILQYARKFPTKTVNILSRINFELPDKYKGTFLEKWHKYWKNLILDYKEVGVDTVKSVKERPLKAATYISGLGVILYLVKNNPDEHNFQSAFISCLNDISVVGETIRNPSSQEHLDFLQRCYNANVLRRLNIGIMSFIWVDNYDSVCKLYKAQCTYLQPKYSTFHERIVDVGFLNTWWGLRKYMEDYDVNPKEWEKS